MCSSTFVILLLRLAPYISLSLTLLPQMCTKIPNWPLCTGTSSTPPQMRMYFHASIRDYILFKFAVPETKGMYALAWILVMLAAVFHESFKWVYWRCDKRWKEIKREGYAVRA